MCAGGKEYITLKTRFFKQQRPLTATHSARTQGTKCQLARTTMSSRMYQSYQGPTDPSLTHSLTEGYQPVSRIGEVVINSFSTPIPIRTTLTHTGG